VGGVAVHPGGGHHHHAEQLQLRGEHPAHAERRVQKLQAHRLEIQPGDAILLIVEDDPHYARILLDLARDKGFKVLLSMRGDDAIDLAKQYQPTAVSLDVFLPDMLGWTVLSQLKQNPATRHIPVMVLSISNEGIHALSVGAAEWLRKPLDSEALVSALRRLVATSKSKTPTALLLDEEDQSVETTSAALRHEGFDVTVARDGKQALQLLKRGRPDVVLLDLMQPRLLGFEVLDALRSAPETASTPVVVLAGRVEDMETQRGLTLGARKFLSKPFDVRTLVAEVHRQAGRGVAEAPENRARA